jgi:hypothetical protein
MYRDPSSNAEVRMSDNSILGKPILYYLLVRKQGFVHSAWVADETSFHSG